MTTLFSDQWHTSPTAYWSIDYEYQRSGVDMQYRFHYKVWLKYSSSYYYNAMQIFLFLNGVQRNITVKGYNSSEYGWSYEGTTEWYTVSNKTSGTVPFYAKLYDGSYGTIEDVSATFNLTVSGSMSTFGTIGSFDVENGVTIPITKYEPSFVDTLVIYHGATPIKTVPNFTNGTTVTFTSTELETIFELMAHRKDSAFIFQITSVDGNTTIGSSYATAIGYISNADPDFGEGDVVYLDINTTVTDITGNPLQIVQNKSILSVDIPEATPKKCATIAQYAVTVNGVTKTVTASQTIHFGTVNSANDVTLTLVATDSRGNTATIEKTVTMLAWAEPTFTATVERINNYETDTIIKPKSNFASVDGKNEVTVTYQSKKVGDEYGDPAEIINGKENIVALDNNYDYWVLIVITDKFGGTASNEYFVPKGKFPLFIDTEKAAVGINEFPSKGEALRVAGGVACFEDGIVLKAESKSFKITINDSGELVIAEIKQGGT